MRKIMFAKKALVTGITGQDGAYLAKHLLDNGYEVYGTYRRSASGTPWRLDYLGITDKVKLVGMELLEFSNILHVVEKIRPDEIYNLAAQSFVKTSFDEPLYTADVDGLGVVRLLESIRKIKPDTKFYQASTSEMYGRTSEGKQNEKTAFRPCSPYAAAKLYAHWMVTNYREGYGLYACSGILFNHESPLRGEEFVTRKITTTLAKIKRGKHDVLELGNVDSFRDWGYAGDYVKAMWLMLQQEKPEDYVIATGETHTIREFANLAAKIIGYNLEWSGKGLDTIAVDSKSGKTLIRINPQYFRPVEVDVLIGDASKAKKELKWQPEVSFENLVEMMMKADFDLIGNNFQPQVLSA